MTVSIITAVFDNKAEIANAVKSVLSQNFANIEYIIVDGGSTDGTIEIINSCKDEISKIISEPDKGIYDALNKGISVATGDIVGILHSDDVFENENIVSSIVKVFEKTNCDGVYGDLLYVSKENSDSIIRFWKSNEYKPNMLKKGWMPPHPTLFLKRQIFEKHGLYDINFKIAADYDFMLRILSRPELNFSYMPQIISRMRLGGASNRSLKNIIQKSREDLKALKKNKIGGMNTLILKNFSKIGQFFTKK